MYGGRAISKFSFRWIFLDLIKWGFFYSSGSVINFVDIFGNAGKDIF